MYRVSPNFRLKRKEAKRKRKKRKRKKRKLKKRKRKKEAKERKKVFVLLHFATKRKSLLYAKMNRIGSEKIFKSESKIKIKIYTEQKIFYFDKK
jgi:hypothetical protein